MNELGAAFATAFGLIAALDGDLVAIVGLSLRVSLTAVVLAAAVAVVSAVRSMPTRRALPSCATRR